MADEAHAVGEKLVVIAQLRLLQNRLGRGIDFCSIDPGTDWLECCLLGSLDLGKKVFKLGVRLAGNAHAGEIADVTVIIAAQSSRSGSALLPDLIRGRAV